MTVFIQVVHQKINLSLKTKIQKTQYGGQQMNTRMINHKASKEASGLL